MTEVRLAQLREQPLSVDELLDAVADPAAGGTAVFIGTVREHDAGRPVTELEYSAHPRAAADLRRVVGNVAGAHDVIAAAAVHRLGLLKIGDLAVVVAASAAHRGEAFAAARELIDRVKAEVPIWKRQCFADGSEEWVGAT